MRSARGVYFLNLRGGWGWVGGIVGVAYLMVGSSFEKELLGAWQGAPCNAIYPDPDPDPAQNSEELLGSQREGVGPCHVRGFASTAVPNPHSHGGKRVGSYHAWPPLPFPAHAAIEGRGGKPPSSPKHNISEGAIPFSLPWLVIHPL